MYFVSFFASLLLIASSNSAYLTCRDGGAGPCLGLLCPDTNNFACIHTSDVDLGTCCNFAQIVNPKGPAVATTTTTTAAPITPTGSMRGQGKPLTGVSDCPKHANLCNEPAYYAFMAEQCPRTCNRCDEGIVCQDKVNPVTKVSDCAKNVHLCQNPMYSRLMREQCPKTCGYCH